MSYMCHATNEVVLGEGRVLVPTEIRKVIYVAQIKPDPRSSYLQFAGQSEGWEILREVSVRKSKAAEFIAANPPRVVKEKEVRYMKPLPPRERYVRKGHDEDNDKGDD